MFALDAASDFLVALCVQIAVLFFLMLLLGHVGFPGPEVVRSVSGAFLLTPFVLSGATICCAFDAARSPFDPEKRIGYELAAFAFSGFARAVAMLGAGPGAMLAVLTVACLAMVVIFLRLAE